MKATQLPSGNWRVRVYDRRTKKTISITETTERKALRAAEDWYDEHADDVGLTFRQAFDNYMDERAKTLSPNTIRVYNQTHDRYFGDLDDMIIDRITRHDLQMYVNDLIDSGLSAKTVRNVYSLAGAVIKEASGKSYSVKLPRKSAQPAIMPSDDEIRALLAGIEGNLIEVPVLLALFGPMRRGEIAALQGEDIDGDVIHVQRAYAQDEDKQWVLKDPKTFSGDRYIKYPQAVIDRLPKTGRVTELNPMMITKRFQRLAKKLGFPYTFHQLRHWSVSYLASQHVP